MPKLHVDKPDRDGDAVADRKNPEKPVEKAPPDELVISPNMTIVVIAKRGSGKSVLSKYLLKMLMLQNCEAGRPKVDTVFLFSTTELYSHSFGCIPKEYVCKKFDCKLIEDILHEQEKACKKWGKDDPRVRRVLLIFDDMLGSVRSGSNEQMLLNRLFCTSRHIAVSLLVIAQASRGLISPVIRGNIDILCIRSISDDHLRTIYEAVYYPGRYVDFVKFYKASLAKSKYGFLTYENTGDGRFLLVEAVQSDFQITMSGGGGAAECREKKTNRKTAH